MFCNKCNHKLPDDSEFCQYCGCKIEKQVEEDPIPVATPSAPVTPIDETTLDDITTDNALNVFVEAQAKNTVEAMEANSKTQPNNEGDSDFGLIPEKPIFTLAVMSVDGEEEYLNRLYTANGEKIKYNRRGSISIEGINGVIDIYETFLPSGQPYKTIYINMYGAKKSTGAPVGFVLNTPSAQVKPAPKKKKPVKTKYCSRCGSVVDSETKICTGCGKKYFKGIRFNKFSITVIILSLALITSVIVNICQYDKISDLRNEKYTNVAKINFFDNCAEIVGNNGTNVYHKYGCSKLDTSDGFWLFNSEAAKAKGYTKCSHCH